MAARIRPTKAELVALLTEQTNTLNNTRSELARCEATLEASRAECDALSEELRTHKDALHKLSVEFVTLQDSIAEQQKAAAVITTRAALMAKMRELAAQGMPVIMRGDFLYHGVTKAIIAQRVNA